MNELSVAKSAIALGAQCPHIHEGSFIMKGLILARSLFPTIYSLYEGSVFAQSQGSSDPNPQWLWQWLLRLPAWEVNSLVLPVNSGRIGKHKKTTTCECTGGACSESSLKQAFLYRMHSPGY